MLCILQTIRQHMQGDVIKKDLFKIVYVAPMKALAAEMTETFGKRSLVVFVLRVFRAPREKSKRFKS